MAYMAEDVADNAVAFQFLGHARRAGKRAVAIAMGEAGEPSRILYRKFGGWATYASADADTPSAPGQIPASLLDGLYRARELTRRTKVYGVLGNPVGHSRGIFVHNPLLHAAGRDAVYCRFPARNLRRFFGEFMPIVAGCSVTLPFKEKVGRYLDATDTVARAVGAVNTIYRRGKRLCGTNTDAAAALDAVERVRPVAGMRVCVLGAGGAARAIVFEARRRGARVTVANRTAGRGERLAREFGVQALDITAVRAEEFDILMNATSVGMTPRESETPLKVSGAKGKIVFDAVYNPPVTRFLREARRAGARIISGTEMYVHQGARQFRLFNRLSPDLGRMRRLLAASPR
jgi:3-dehydroquinate dehydratase/shikimate dehydrogenase